MIEVKNLTKYYGDFRAVDNISFTINDGEIMGLLGPNGAGKSTTIKMLTCYMPPSKGSILYDNRYSVTEHSMEIRRKLGYLPESAPLYLEMGIIEYLEFICDLRELYGDRRKDRIDAMVETCGLRPMLGKNIGELSKGYRQRVGIAQALIHEPEILVLDEPTVGLDPNQVVEIRNLIKEIGRKKTVILSTHILSEVEATCNRVLIIASGEIVADGSSSDLKGRLQEHTVIHLELKEPVPETSFDDIRGVESVARGGKSETGGVLYEIAVKGTADIREDIFRRAVSKNMTVLEMHQQKNSLEDVFRLHTRIQGE